MKQKQNEGSKIKMKQNQNEGSKIKTKESKSRKGLSKIKMKEAKSKLRDCQNHGINNKSVSLPILPSSLFFPHTTPATPRSKGNNKGECVISVLILRVRVKGREIYIWVTGGGAGE